MKTINIYDNLSKLGLFTAPFAPAFFFSYRVYLEVREFGEWSILATPVAIIAGIGFELVGIMAGHMLVSSLKASKFTQSFFSGVLMLFYVGVGVYELQGTIGAISFIIAPCIYLLVAMYENDKTRTNDDSERSKILLHHQLEEEKKNNETRREIRLMKAKISVKPHETFPKPTETATKVSELSGNKKKVFEAFKENPDFTNKQVSEMIGITPQRVGQIKKNLNGAL